MKQWKYMLRVAMSLSFLFYSSTVSGQYEDFHTVRATVDFSDILRIWDGFGVNYVQTAHTTDYSVFPQEYGGFSLLDNQKKEEIIELIFGRDGIRPGIVKMFLDPLHQTHAGGPYDHLTSTRYMLEFFEKGLEKTKSWGGDLKIITTLYSPPAYTTRQKELRGRDMDPAHKEDIAMYMIDWARFLQERGYPIRYISFHNEGEDWRRWAEEGDYANFDHGHDYNLYWRPEEVADFLAFMPGMMEKNGLTGIGLTPGECSRFLQFYYSGYAKAILEDPEALKNLSLITSHNFYRVLPPGHRWFAGTANPGTELIRDAKPGIGAWVTSASWGNMDVEFIWQIWMNIYFTGINAYVPWACIQRPAHWVNKDPNPGTAIVVDEEGKYNVRRGYYLYKQVARAGQPGMGVAMTTCMDPELQLIGFASNGTINPDAFVMINIHNYVPSRTDAVEIVINEKNFIFSNQDPAFNNHRETYERHKYAGIKSTSVRTDEGYLLETAIPWKNLEIQPETDPGLDLMVRIREGAYSLSGEILWQGDTSFYLAERNGTHTISKFDCAPAIDGKDEGEWLGKEEFTVKVSNHPNTDPDLAAYWRTGYDQEFMYFFVRVKDRTNLQGRKVEIDLQGSNYKRFTMVRSIDDRETAQYLGIVEAENGKLIYEVPPRSVTTFTGIK